MPYRTSAVLLAAWASLSCPVADFRIAEAAGPETLTDRLRAEPPDALVKAAREHGDAARGAVLFFQPFLSCAKCHDAATGGSLGPDLSKAGPDVTPAYLLESVLHPSKQIKKGFATVVIRTSDEKTLTGLIGAETADTVTVLDPAAGGRGVVIRKADIEQRRDAPQSLMPEGLMNPLSDRQQFLDLMKYLFEIAEGGPARARELRPAVTTFTLPEYEKDIDHAGLIRGLDDKSFKRGEAIYLRVCANCHGTREQAGSLPTSPRFAAHTFKNGNDPHSLYRTLTHGFNMMVPQTWMVPRQKYDVIHYLREDYLRTHNPSQYARVDDAYLDKLPKGKGFGPAPVTVEPWVTMDYGPALVNTYEISGGARPDIAYKGIAVRLDPGTGGVSRGRHWAMFEHDTLRFAAAWSGEGFIDWNGIHFNGRHGVHPKIAGKPLFAVPTGPGWADPATGSFADPRPKGRDGRPYGPLPRAWGRFRGLYAYGDRTVVAATIGDADVLELAGMEHDASGSGVVVTRTIETGKSSRDLRTRVAPEDASAAVVGDARIVLSKQDGFHILTIPAAATPARVKVLISRPAPAGLAEHAKASAAPMPLRPFTGGGPRRWTETVRTEVTIGKGDGPFVADTFVLPGRNPWNALIRPTGFDFHPDGRRMAVCTWDGDVWMVEGADKPESGITWRRIATGMFQPLGLKYRDGAIFVCCRDQIVKLHDLNGDGETDFYESFNSDHQVTEHFHEFAMGLQTDADGNFYYAKSGCHGLQAKVPHHGTLLKVSRDGATTEILATGFRAANGVCVNPDGTFFVTDQEGFWTPKNRINLVERGGFYGNLWGWTDVTDTADSAMKPPLCWVTNTFDRSPAEMVRVPAGTWGPLAGSLLNTSYGTGQIHVVPYEIIDGKPQGGMCALPLPAFATGIMRPRFHPTDGHLYVCGMFAWAGNAQSPGGFHRVRYVGGPMHLPVGLRAERDGMRITLTDAVDPASVVPAAFAVKVWGLKRSRGYGSKHIDEKTPDVSSVELSPDGKTVRLVIRDFAPTMGMELRWRLKGADGRAVSGVIHNTVHEAGAKP